MTVGGVTATYVYDGDGSRVEDAAANRLFWYGASGNLLETTDAGSTNHDYIYFAGRRIARYDSGGMVSYLYDDADGSLRTMTDASGNQLCWADYYPFGQPVSGTGCSGDNYQFAGLYSDATGEDGGDSAANRRYNDTYFRWFSPDPGGVKVVRLDNPQTWNMYAYVGDNPTTLNDPSGLTPPALPAAADGDGCPQKGSDNCKKAQNTNPTQRLTNAQDAARNSPSFKKSPNGTTYCNIATCGIARAMGAPTGALTNPRNGQPAIANQIATNLARPGSGYRQVSPAEAQQLANEGRLVIAVQPHAGHGHVATVRPGGTGSDPLINNIGAHSAVWPASRAFYASPAVKYYTPH